MRSFRPRRETIWILFFAVIKLGLHLFTSSNYGLHRDEYLVLAESARPDFGFMSVPPLTAAMTAAATGLLGDSPAAVRLLPALAGAATVALAGLTAVVLGGRSLAVVIACLAVLLSPSTLRANSMLQPVTFDIFFWTLSAFLAARLLKSGDTRWWIALGAAWGLAFLNKYAIVFFAAAFLAGVAVSRRRGLLASRHALAGAAAGLVLILPNVIWQAMHGWPVAYHMAELQRTQLVNVSVSGFLLDQVVMNVHAVIVWMAGLAALLFLRHEKPFRPLGLAAVLCVGLLLLARGKSYYTLGLYPMLLAAGGAALERLPPRPGRAAVAAVLVLMSLGVMAAPYGLPLLRHEAMVKYGRATAHYAGNAPLRWETGRVHELPQDYADMIGWEELGGLVLRAWAFLPESERPRCAVWAGNYGQAAAIRYHTRAAGLPEPMSFNDQFLLWTPDSLAFDHLIYADDDTAAIRPMFETVRLVGVLSNPLARERGLPVTLCRGRRPALDAHYRSERDDWFRRIRRE